MSATHSATAVAFRPRRLAHANVVTGDLERATSFYRDVCGLNPVYQAAEVAAVFLSNGSSHHDLLLVEIPGLTGALQHLGWEMETEQDLVAAFTRASDTGVEIERTTDHDVTKSVYVLDPDGVRDEFYADTIRDWRVWYSSIESLRSGPWDPRAAVPAAERRYDPQPQLRHLDDALIPVRQLSRAALLVEDLDVSISFYMDVAGLELLGRDAAGRAAYLGGTLGRYDLALIQSDETGDTRLGKLVFEVADPASLTVERAELDSAGVQVLGRMDDDDKLAFLVRDSDGRIVELVATRRPGIPSHAPADPLDRLLHV